MKQAGEIISCLPFLVHLSPEMLPRPLPGDPLSCFGKEGNKKPTKGALRATAAGWTGEGIRLPTSLFRCIPCRKCSPGPFRGTHFLAAEQESGQRSRLKGALRAKAPPLRTPQPPRQRRWGEFDGGLRPVYREFVKPNMQRSKSCQALIGGFY